MKTRLKMTIIITACLIMVLGAIGIGVLTASADNPTSGTCGPDLTWEYSESTKVLTISGSGKMNNYSAPGTPSAPPWQSFRKTTEKIIVNSGVLNIGNFAFDEFVKLTNVSLSKSVNSLGAKSFSSCIELETFNITDGITSIGNFAFSDCTGLVSIIIPENVSNLGDSAFSGCKGLSTVIISNGITSIGKETFAGCSSLSSISIPSSVKSIGSRAFAFCNYLTDLTIPNSVQSIENEGLGLGAFHLVPNVNYYGTASGSPWGARSVNGYIDDSLVYSDSSRTKILACSAAVKGSITIPDSVQSIEYMAFTDCSGMTNINIPQTVNKIGYGAFSYCSGIKKIDIPNSVSEIGNYAFIECSGLTEVIIPDSVNGIGICSFGGCSGLKKAILGESCKSIKKEAFTNCTSLSSVYIPSKTTTIDDSSFYECRSLKDVYYGGKSKTDIDIKSNNSYLINATWHYYSAKPESKTFTLTYDANGGNGAPANQTGSGDVTLSAIRPTKDYYTFLGWAINSSSTVAQYQPGANFTLTDNTTLFAVWKYNGGQTPISYVLNYNANGGSGAPENQTGSGYINISSIKPTRNGYTFLGWATSSNATSVQYGSGSPINLNRNITIYAVWLKNNTPDTPGIIKANIIRGNNIDGKRAFNYRSTVTFTAITPEGVSIQWYVNGNPAGNGSTLTVKDKTNDYTVKVIVTDKNGNKTMDEEQVTIKHGFFDILIWFFVHLFNPGAYDVKQ